MHHESGKPVPPNNILPSHSRSKYHDREPNELDPPDRIVNLFISESTAYQRLESKGLCQRGVTPNFYGTIRKIQPADWPNLHMFLNDKLPPNAVLIEYIPHLQQIDLSNYTPQRLAKLREILDDIHAAGVLHADPKPRNMMVSVAEEEERVLWIDFDSAQTVSECGDPSPKQRRWFDQEDEMMDYFVDALVGFCGLVVYCFCLLTVNRRRISMKES